MSKLMNMIDQLPDAILLDILSYLSVKERCFAARVCQRWREIVSDNSLWRHVDLLSYHLDLQRMWKILRTHFSPCLITLKVRGFAHSETTRKRKKSSLSDSMLKELSNRCPNLKVLHLHDCKTENICVENIPSTVNVLSVTRSSWKPRWFQYKPNNLSNLHSLFLDRTVRIDRLDLLDIAQFPDLKMLSLSGCYRIESMGIQILTNSFLSLEFLDLSYINIEGIDVHHISRNLKKLKRLHLKSCGLSNSMLESLNVCNSLEILDISENKSISQEGIECLRCLKTLKIIQ